MYNIYVHIYNIYNIVIEFQKRAVDRTRETACDAATAARDECISVAGRCEHAPLVTGGRHRTARPAEQPRTRTSSSSRLGQSGTLVAVSSGASM